METVIRAMTLDDAPLLAAWMVETPLWQRYQLTADRAVENFKAGLARGDWLFTADSELPACGFAWVLPGGAFGRSPYLRLIGVHPQMIGAGIGAKLLHTVEQRTLEIAQDLFLLVSDFNLEAQRFYQRQGYTQIGAIPGYVLPDVTELIFRKRLS